MAVRIADNLTLAKIMAKPSLGVGEAYMDGRLTIEQGTIHDLVDLTLKKCRRSPPRAPGPAL